MILISVVIPSYNSARTIERCIRSIFTHAPDDVEVIVVDDKSTDDSAARVEQLRSIWPGRVRIIWQNSNSGPAKARNVGARAACGDWLFFLDSDTEMLSDTLANFRKRSMQADAVIGIYHHSPLNDGIVPLYKALLNHYFFSRRGVVPYEVFDAARAGIRREVFNAVGGFNENLGRGMDYENEELGYRLCERFRLILDPSVAVRHNFPTFWMLTRTYFNRVALWAQIFFHRRRFESGGLTSGSTGLSSAALLGSIGCAELALLLPAAAGFYSAAVACGLFAIYLLGYLGFFWYVARLHPLKLPQIVALNIYFTLVIACGAFVGFGRVFLGFRMPGSSVSLSV